MQPRKFAGRFDRGLRQCFAPSQDHSAIADTPDFCTSRRFRQRPVMSQFEFLPPDRNLLSQTYFVASVVPAASGSGVKVVSVAANILCLKRIVPLTASSVSVNQPIGGRAAISFLISAASSAVSNFSAFTPAFPPKC